MNDNLHIQHVIVIGNGGAGSQVAARLGKLKKYRVTVITPFEYQEVSLEMTSVVAIGPTAHFRSIYPNRPEDGVEYIVGSCTKLNDRSIEVGERNLEFDACVVCSGQHIPVFMPEPCKETLMEERKLHIHNVYQEILRANSIVISGGGPIGLETAADIKLRHPEKRVTVVHSHGEVLLGMPAGYRPLALHALKKMGVEVVLNDRVTSFENDKVVLRSGVTLPCEYYIPAASTGAHTQFMPAACLDEKGYVRVNNHLEVEGLSGVFALGDCSNLGPKTYPCIEDQLPTLMNNLQAFLDGRPMKNHVTGFMGWLQGPMLVALGHDVAGSYGLGPELPTSFLSNLCWCCPLFGGCCAPPAGKLSAISKSTFNHMVRPRKGKGIARW